MSWLMPMLIAQAIAAPFMAPPVSDGDLAQMRGGFSLPNGVDVAMAVQTQTRIDGAVVLRTVFQADQGPARFAAYVPTSADALNASRSGQKSAMATTAPVIEFDNRNSIRISPGVPLPAVNAGQSDAGSGSLDGFVAAGTDAPTQTGAGVVSVSTQGPTYRATLDSAMLSVSHLAGQAFGSVVANSADNRTIDVETTIDLRLGGVSPDVLGSAMFRVEGTALDALRSRLP